MLTLCPYCATQIEVFEHVILCAGCGCPVNREPDEQIAKKCVFRADVKHRENLRIERKKDEKKIESF